jgi:hypothetical protein
MQIEPEPSRPVTAAPGQPPADADAEVVEVVDAIEVVDVVEVEVGPDRDRVTLEGLEAELAVLEDELARVDAGRGGEDPAPARGDRS